MPRWMRWTFALVLIEVLLIFLGPALFAFADAMLPPYN